MMGADSIWKQFVITMVVMAFYSVGITLLAYSLPVESVVFVEFAQGFGSDLEEMSLEVQASLEQQTNIPLIDLGALIFYSSNILLDLLLNFAFAIPQMIALVFNGLSLLFNFDSYVVNVVQLFASVVVVFLYFIGLLSLLTSQRSGRLV